MRPTVLLIIVNAILLALASTNFTIVTVLGGAPFQWNAFQYTSQWGWGKIYQSPYSLPVVLTYLAAYSTGLIAYLSVWRNGSLFIGCAGIILCAFGITSFAYELTHWFHEFYESWIAHSAGLTLLLAIPALIQTYRKKEQPRSAAT